MSRSCIAVFTLIAALAVPASADKGKGPKNDKAQAAQHGKHEQHAQDKQDQGWEKRDGVEMRVFGRNDGHPAGWTQGKKTGWKDCGLPPGQAKKYQCYTYKHSGHRYFYYRDEGGRLIVRRSSVSIFGIFR